ncbi:hypothetical protein CEXT_75581 [Caerostris extrusa]|uniref:Uncharacterized protein n=1 Tax=Caerostris extrusa TaxID=172846 RepID=A0AAV4XU84_CAEEX|nr:hypothetical protein CEXT_75581 [Caerostris extrusa]
MMSFKICYVGKRYDDNENHGKLYVAHIVDDHILTKYVVIRCDAIPDCYNHNFSNITLNYMRPYATHIVDGHILTKDVVINSLKAWKF